ncbi:MAG: hypothetical protein KC766_00390 [Myxococcales bacterium]|nr:hypothetical protein [Myxococcales bacterium]
MRASTIACFAFSSLVFGACLQIERVPDAENTSGGSAGQGNDGGLGGDAAAYDAGACPNACMGEHPSARPLFQALSACIGLGTDDQCAAACAEGAAGSETPSCSTLGVVDPRPTCNACVKDLCCDRLAACLEDTECFKISLCAAACE